MIMMNITLPGYCILTNMPSVSSEQSLCFHPTPPTWQSWDHNEHSPEDDKDNDNDDDDANDEKKEQVTTWLFAQKIDTEAAS